METLFAISNGNLGVRGTSDLPGPAAQADLFVAGVYDQRVASQPYSEVELFDSSDARSAETEIVPLPFPFHFHVRMDGEPIHAAKCKSAGNRRCSGFSERDILRAEPVRIPSRPKNRNIGFRICSHSDPNLLIQKIKLTSENYSAQIEIDLSLLPDELAELYPHIKSVFESTMVIPPKGTDHGAPTVSTIGSKDFVSLCSRILANGRELRSPRISMCLAPGETLVIERSQRILESDSKTSAE